MFVSKAGKVQLIDDGTLPYWQGLGWVETSEADAIAAPTQTNPGGVLTPAAPVGGTSVAFADRGAWATTTAYVVGDIVTQSGLRYITKTAHTSGTFATDLAAAKWVLLEAYTATPLTDQGVYTAGTVYAATDAVVTPDGKAQTPVTAPYTAPGTYAPAAWSTASGKTVNGLLNNITGYYVPKDWGKFWRPKLVAGLAGTGKAIVGVCGDSIAQGYFASNLDTAGWAGLLQAALQGAAGSASDGGSGFKGANASTKSTGLTVYTSSTGYIATTGLWNQAPVLGGPGLGALNTANAGDTATFVRRGTVVKVFYGVGYAGSFTVTIDGGAPVTVTNTTAGQAIATYTVSGLSNASHTIVVTVVSGSVILCGATGENTTGVLLNNFSQQSKASAAPIQTGWGSMPGWNGGFNYPCDLLIYGMFVNDANVNVTGDTYLANVETYLTAVRSPGSVSATSGATDVIVFLPHLGKFDTAATPKGQDYVARLRGLCEAYGAALVNQWALGRNSWDWWSNQSFWVNASVPGSNGTDAVHPSDAGHAAMFKAIAPLVLATS